MTKTKMQSLASRFGKDQRGGVAILFGLSTIPFFLFAGFALDYARGVAYQTRMQAAVDSTALALAKLPSTTPVTQLRSRGQELFAAFYGNAGGEAVDLKVDPVADGVKVRGAAKLQTTLMRVAGFEEMPVSASSQAVYAKNRIEVALVLDNTGSMGQLGKMPALKAAVNDFITKLQAIPADPGAIKMSVVPFNTEVKIGAGYAGAGLRWNVKLENPSLGAVAPPTSAANWTGCVADRDQPYDAQSGGGASYIAANCLYSPLAQMAALTTDLNSVRATTNSMQPAGATNLAVGFTMGLATLRDDTPFGGQSSNASDVKKFLVLLTDGNNTQNRWGGNGSEGNAYVSQIDARMQEACEGARHGRDSRVTVFTIRVIAGNAALLSNCATTPQNYFPAASAADIAPAFEAILNKITNLRLSS